MMGWEGEEGGGKGPLAAKYSNFLFPFSLSLCWPGMARVIGPLGVHFSFSGVLPLLKLSNNNPGSLLLLTDLETWMDDIDM